MKRDRTKAVLRFNGVETHLCTPYYTALYYDLQVIFFFLKIYLFSIERILYLKYVFKLGITRFQAGYQRKSGRSGFSC